MDPLMDDKSTTLPPLCYRIHALTLSMAQNMAKLEVFHFVSTRFLDQEDFKRLIILTDLDWVIEGIG